MSYVVLNTYSSALNMRAEVRAVIPEYPLQGMDGIPHRQRYDRKIRFPVVYLLHGYTGDYTDWMNMIPIERYAETVNGCK